MDQNKNCFISYSWDSDFHKSWVRDLATKLQTNGIQTYLDQWDLVPGSNLTSYMEESISKSDYVLLICTKNFAFKANSNLGGVGYEKTIITGEIFYHLDTLKFIPLLRADSPEEALPNYLKSKLFIDFRNDFSFDSSFDELLRTIYDEPIHSRPNLGKIPSFSSSNLEDLDTDFISKLTYLDEIPPKKNRYSSNEIIDFAKSVMGKNNFYSEQFSKEWLNKYSEYDFDVFMEAFRFAKSDMGKNNFYSEQFSKEWVKKYSENDFDVFMEAFRFAKSDMGKNNFYSEQFSKEWLNKYSEYDFDVFMEAFRFAKSDMGKNNFYSEQFSKEWVDKYSNRYFSNFQDNFRFAKSSLGKNNYYSEIYAKDNL